mgnify:CR=1 FL=1
MLADIVTSYFGFTVAEQQQVLETVNLLPRLDRVLSLLAYRREVLRLSQDP